MLWVWLVAKEVGNSGVGLVEWYEWMYFFSGVKEWRLSRNVIGPKGISLKHEPMCFPWEGNKPLSHKESVNKVRTRLAVGIDEIHPLLIVPSGPKGFAEGKGQAVKKRQRNVLLWVCKECFLCFIV